MFRYQILFSVLLISSPALGEIRDGKQADGGPDQIRAETVSCWQSGKQIVGPLKLASISLSATRPSSSVQQAADSFIIEGISATQERVRIIVSRDTTCQLIEG